MSGNAKAEDFCIDQNRISPDSARIFQLVNALGYAGAGQADLFRKTTILNALLWCFYGETTRRFEKREDIVNHDAKKVGRTTASVEVLFSHNGKDYIAKRFAGSGSLISEDRSFLVARIDAGSQAAQSL